MAATRVENSLPLRCALREAVEITRRAAVFIMVSSMTMQIQVSGFPHLLLASGRPLAVSAFVRCSWGQLPVDMQTVDRNRLSFVHDNATYARTP